MSHARISTRRFTLADLMILIAATGAGMAMFRPYQAALAGPGFQNAGVLRTIETTYGAWSFLAAWWMIALLIIQYRGVHPHRSRLARRPGHVACGVAAVALVAGITQELTRFTFQDPIIKAFSFHQSWITMSARVGPAVAGAWFVLALSGRWRADGGWIDRLGRLLGCCWIGWQLLWMIPNVIRLQIPPFCDGVLT